MDDNDKRSEALREEIERLAYSKYCDRGFAPGHELDDWLAAEQEVLARDGAPLQQDDVSTDRRKRRAKRQ